MINRPPEGISICRDSCDSLEEVIVQMQGASGTLYAGESYKILFKFSKQYPFESPQVSNTLYQDFIHYILLMNI